MVSEKQSQLRLFLINMNIGNIIHYMSWYFKGVLYLSISSLIVTLLLKVGGVKFRERINEMDCFVFRSTGVTIMPF